MVILPYINIPVNPKWLLEHFFRGGVVAVNFGHWTPQNDFWWYLTQTIFVNFLGIFFLLFLAFLAHKKLQILVTGHPKWLLGVFGTKQFCSIFFLLFWHFGPTKNAIFDHWTSPDDHGRHLGPKKSNFFCQLFSVVGILGPQKNVTFCHWMPQMTDIFGQQKMQFFVIGHPQMTFGGIWDKKKLGGGCSYF